MITLILALIVILLLIFHAPLKPALFPPGIYLFFNLYFLNINIFFSKFCAKGPVWLPVVGCAPQLKKLTKKLGYQHNVFLWLSERYKSPVIGLRLGTQLVVAVSGYEAVRQIFTREEFEGRPDTFFIRMRSMGTRKGNFSDFFFKFI
jgi:hypothetical protein